MLQYIMSHQAAHWVLDLFGTLSEKYEKVRPHTISLIQFLLFIHTTCLFNYIFNFI